MDSMDKYVQEVTEKAQAKAAAEIRHAEDDEVRIARVIGVRPYMVHHYKLYGRVGTLAFKTFERYSSLNTPIIAPADVLRLATEFPGVPMCRYKSRGSVGFQERAYFDEVESTRSTRNENATCEDIAPARIAIDGYSTKLEWCAELPGGLGVWEFSIELPQYAPNVGMVQVERGGHAAWPIEARPITRCELHVAQPIVSVYRELAVGDPLAAANGMPDGGTLHVAQARTQKYASGSQTSVNPFVIYWDDCAPSDYPSQVADVVRAIWPVEGK